MMYLQNAIALDDTLVPFVVSPCQLALASGMGHPVNANLETQYAPEMFQVIV